MKGSPLRSGVLLTLVGLAATLAVAGLSLHLLARSSGVPGLAGLPQAVALALGGVVLTALGVLIVGRLPGNVIGWAFVAAGLGLAVGGLAESHVVYSYAPGNDPLPGATIAGLLIRGSLAVAVWMPVFAVLLLFPSGRPVSPRWRPLTWVSFGVVAAVAVTSLLAPGPLVEPLGGLRTVPDNPLGLTTQSGVVESIGGALWPALSLCLTAATISVAIRYRRARGVEREQLRWFAWSASVVVVGTLLMSIMGIVYGEQSRPPLMDALVLTLVVGGLASLPVSVTVAILRYRLYAIDRLISRTVSYGLLTALLVGGYAAGVVMLGGLLRSLTGDGGDLAVAASTLGVAAAFRPLRRRVHAVVERRFDRARYDARRTVEEFAHRLRDEVDPDLLADHVRQTTRTTVQPSHVSIWFALERSR